MYMHIAYFFYLRDELLTLEMRKRILLLVYYVICLPSGHKITCTRASSNKTGPKAHTSRVRVRRIFLRPAFSFDRANQTKR